MSQDFIHEAKKNIGSGTEIPVVMCLRVLLNEVETNKQLRCQV
jgi:hypothetical protein